MISGSCRTLFRLQDEKRLSGEELGARRSEAICCSEWGLLHKMYGAASDGRDAIESDRVTREDEMKWDDRNTQ